MRLVQPGEQDQPDLLVLPDLRELRVHQSIREQLETLVLRDQRVLPDPREFLELLLVQEQPGQQVKS